jgi:hypothetical protein
MAARKPKIELNRIMTWPDGALGEPRGKGLRSRATRIEPRPVEQWLRSASESGLSVGDIVELVTDPQKIQKRVEMIPGEVLLVPADSVMIDVRFTVFGSAGYGSSSHRTFIQQVPAWKLKRSDGGAAALNFIANFDAAPGEAPEQAVVKSADALSKTLQEVGPATHVELLSDGGVTLATHTAIGPVQVLALFMKGGTVHLTVKATNAKSARALLQRLAPPRVRATESQTETPPKKAEAAA